jgi:hypothetical protein
MSSHTGVVSKSDLKRLAVKTIKSTQHHFKTMKAGGHFFCFNDRTTQCQDTDVLRWMTEMSSGEPGGNTLRNLLLNALVSSEAKQSSSGVICGQVLLDFLTQYLRYQHLKESDLKEISDDLAEISKTSYRATSHEIFEMLKSINRDPISSDIANAAIRLAGSNGTIHLETEASSTTIINLVQGYNFPIELPEIFVSAARLSSERKFINPKICVIDGLVERVSEINGMIQKSYEKKQPLILVARGYSSDVQNTLGVNFASGNLSVIPLVVPYDEFGANLVNDIAVVAGCDLVNSLKGDIISAINWDDIKKVSSIKITPSSKNMTILNESTKNSVKLHRKFIKDKKSNVLYGGDTFDKRLACLMGHGVIITLGKDLGDQWGITKDRIEYHLKMFRDASRFGIINLDKTIPVIKNTKIRKSLETIRNSTPIVISRALLIGVKVGVDASQAIGRVGGIVYFDK